MSNNDDPNVAPITVLQLPIEGFDENGSFEGKYLKVLIRSIGAVERLVEGVVDNIVDYTNRLRSKGILPLPRDVDNLRDLDIPIPFESIHDVDVLKVLTDSGFTYKEKVRVSKIVTMNKDIAEFMKAILENPRSLGYNLSISNELLTDEEMLLRYGIVSHLYIDDESSMIGLGDSSVATGDIDICNVSSRRYLRDLDDELYTKVSQYIVEKDYSSILECQLSASTRNYENIHENKQVDWDSHNNIRSFIVDYERKFTLDGKINTIHNACIYIATHNLILNGVISTIFKGKLTEIAFDYGIPSAKQWYMDVFKTPMPVPVRMMPTGL